MSETVASPTGWKPNPRAARRRRADHIATAFGMVMAGIPVLVLASILWTLLPRGLSGLSAAPSSQVSQEVLVSGMTCAHCVSSVTEELGEIDGVEAVEVDLNVGGLSRVTVHSSGPIDDAALTAAVEEAGYARENALS